MKGYSGEYDADHEWMIFIPGTWESMSIIEGFRKKLGLVYWQGYEGCYFTRRLAETLIERHYARYGERLEMRYMR